MSDLENKIEQLLKEVRELKENQKEMTEKMSKMQMNIKSYKRKNGRGWRSL